MPQFLRLAEDERTLRRTVADALAVLHALPNFTAGEQVHIVIQPLRLPSGKIVGLVDLQYCDDDTVFVVSLPTAAFFHAHHAGRQGQKLEIFRLGEATVDAKGQVLLADGSVLRAVEVIPAHLPYEPSALDWQILYRLIDLLHAEDTCFRSFRDHLPPHLAMLAPEDLRFVDCQALAQLEPPPLKVLAAALAEHENPLEVSLQKLADALANFGIRAVTPRPRHKRPSIAAI